MPANDRYHAALLDPVSVYRTPDLLLEDDTLTDAQKLEILRRWETDATHLQESEAEGFQGGERSLLDQVNEAIARLER